jgi:hypothetical protein
LRCRCFLSKFFFCAFFVNFYAQNIEFLFFKWYLSGCLRKAFFVVHVLWWQLCHLAVQILINAASSRLATVHTTAAVVMMQLCLGCSDEFSMILYPCIRPHTIGSYHFMWSVEAQLHSTRVAITLPIAIILTSSLPLRRALSLQPSFD